MLLIHEGSYLLNHFFGEALKLTTEFIILMLINAHSTELQEYRKVSVPTQLFILKGTKSLVLLQHHYSIP